MPLRTDKFDLGTLRLSTGEGRHLQLHVAIDRFLLGGEQYAVRPSPLEARLDISRTTAHGYALRLRLTATLEGPCMRCLRAAEPSFPVDAREIWQPGQGDELESPYVDRGTLDLMAWARDALALALPATILCRADCAGLCPVCGIDLNAAGDDHAHERQPDPRWAKLSELHLE